MTDSGSGDVQRDRLDEDDHDLLTFAEVGERLRLEIVSAESDLAAASASGDQAAVDRSRPYRITIRGGTDRFEFPTRVTDSRETAGRGRTP